MTKTYDFQSLVVLPAIRLNRLHGAVRAITGDREMARDIMEAVEEHLEVDAYRWGNGCPKDGCYERLDHSSGPICPIHGFLGGFAPTELLIAFKPSNQDDS